MAIIAHSFQSILIYRVPVTNYKMTEPNSKIKLSRRTAIIFTAGLTAALLVFISINGLAVKLNESEYCGNRCYEMTPVYQAWKQSTHYNNSTGMITE